MAGRKKSESTALEPVRAFGPSLVDLEERFDALLNTEDMVPDEQREVFEMELLQAGVEVRDKRDRLGQFVTHCERMAEIAKQEGARFDRRQAFYTNAAKRGKFVAQNAIYRIGKGPDGKYRRLEGNIHTWRLQGIADKVEVVNEQEIPDEFKSVTVTLSMLDWKALTAANPWLQVEDVTRSVKITTSLKEVGAAIKAGKEVPGADLLMDQVCVRLD